MLNNDSFATKIFVVDSNTGIIYFFVHFIDNHSVYGIALSHIVGEEEEELHKFAIIKGHCNKVKEIVHTLNHSAPGSKSYLPIEHILMLVALRRVHKINFFKEFSVNAVSLSFAGSSNPYLRLQKALPISEIQDLSSTSKSLTLDIYINFLASWSSGRET